MGEGNLSVLIPNVRSKVDYFLFRLKWNTWKKWEDGFLLRKKRKKQLIEISGGKKKARMNLLKSRLKTQSSFQSGTNKKEELTSFDEVVHKSKTHSSNLKKTASINESESTYQRIVSILSRQKQSEYETAVSKVYPFSQQVKIYQKIHTLTKKNAKYQQNQKC